MKPVKHFFALTLLAVLNTSSFTAWSDWLNLTGAETAPNIAEIYILDDHIKVKLEVYVNDIGEFSELIPDDWMTERMQERPDPDQRMEHFAQNTLTFITDVGTVLSAELLLVEPRMRVDRRSPFAGMINPYTRQRVPEAPADKRVLYAEIKYPFKGQPSNITMVPPLDEEGRARVTVGFIAYHKAVPVIDFRYLGAAAKLNLDWADPWYSKFDNPNLKRHHKSALMSFLYVEPYEVRHEILIRVKDMENWMDLGLRGNEYIEIDELDGLRDRIGAFLLGRNGVKVDGNALKPILDRSNYVTVGVNGIQIHEQPERLEISTAIVGVIISYLTDGLPQQATVDWDLFTDQLQMVPATATDPAGPLPTFLTPDDNVHTWTNYLKNYTVPTVAKVSLQDTVDKLSLPAGLIVGIILSVFMLAWAWSRHRHAQPAVIPAVIGVFVLLAGGLSFNYLRIEVNKPEVMISTLSDEEAQRLVHSLLKNVYRSFDFREESDVYDKLAVSVEGDLLETIYLQNRKSFAVKRAGGAQAKVKDIEILDARKDQVAADGNGFQLVTRWTAQGTVGHWGHVHTRKNYYDARMKIKPVDGHWKITGLEVLEEKRIDPNANPDTAGSTQ